MDARLRCWASFSAWPFSVTWGASEPPEEEDEGDDAPAPAPAPEEAEGAITSMSTIGAAAEDRPEERALEVVE